MMIDNTLCFLPAHPSLFLLARDERVIGRRPVLMVRVIAFFIIIIISSLKIGQIIFVICKWIGKGGSAVCQFDKSNAEGPYVRFDRVCSPLYTFRLDRGGVAKSIKKPLSGMKIGNKKTYAHINRGPHKRIRNRIDKFS